MAAAPGYNLPRYPEPEHVFNKRGTQLSFVLDDCKYSNGKIHYTIHMSEFTNVERKRNGWMMDGYLKLN